jgi:hypothetical protein
VGLCWAYWLAGGGAGLPALEGPAGGRPAGERRGGGREGARGGGYGGGSGLRGAWAQEGPVPGADGLCGLGGRGRTCWGRPCPSTPRAAGLVECLWYHVEEGTRSGVMPCCLPRVGQGVERWRVVCREAGWCVGLSQPSRGRNASQPDPVALPGLLPCLLSSQPGRLPPGFSPTCPLAR